MNYTYTKEYPLKGPFADDDIAWLTDQFGHITPVGGYNETWDILTVRTNPQRLAVTYAFTHRSDYAMFVLRCGDQ